MAGRQALMCSGFNSLQMTWLCRRATYLQPGPFAFCVRGWLLTWRWITWVRYGFGVGESLSFMRVRAPSWFRKAYKGWFPRIHPPVPTHAQLAYSARALRVTGTHQASLSFSLPLGVLACPDSAGRVPKLLRVCQMQDNGEGCITRHVHPCWGDDVRGMGQGCAHLSNLAR